MKSRQSMVVIPSRPLYDEGLNRRLTPDRHRGSPGARSQPLTARSEMCSPTRARDPGPGRRPRGVGLDSGTWSRAQPPAARSWIRSSIRARNPGSGSGRRGAGIGTGKRVREAGGVPASSVWARRWRGSAAPPPEFRPVPLRTGHAVFPPWPPPGSPASLKPIRPPSGSRCSSRARRRRGWRSACMPCLSATKCGPSFNDFCVLPELRALATHSEQSLPKWVGLLARRNEPTVSPAA